MDGAYFLYAADIDGDSDLDVVADGHYADAVVWYENTFVVGIENDVAFIPAEYTLFQNYPNPFNATTTIKFSIPHTEFVTLKILNILGKEVATLVSERLSAREYEYDWDAGEFSSGIYLYRMQTANYIEVKKMVLLK